MKIILIGPYGIGNTIIALPAMKILKKKFPDARIDLIVLLSSTYKMVKNIKDFDLFNNIYFLNKKNFVLVINKLRKIKYDYSVVLFPSAKIYYNILSFLIGAKKRIGSKFPDGNFRRAYFLNNVNIPVILGIHDVFQNINLLSPFGIDYKKFKIKQNKSLLAKKDKNNIIGFHTGCKKDDYYKKWNIKNFLFLAERILKVKKYKIRFFLGPDEKEDYIFLKQYLGSRVEFIFDVPIEEVFKKINECRIFISNDSGLMHIANFLGCYCIVILGPSDFRRTGPFNKPYKLIYKNLSCQPCSHTYYVKSYKFRCIYNEIRCLNQISVEEVFNEVKKFLLKKGGNS